MTTVHDAPPDPIKQSLPGTTSGERRRRHPLRPLEWLTVIHVGVFLIAATWAFGGQADFVRRPLTAWGCLGGLITLAAALEYRGSEWRRATLWWLVPFACFNLLVIAATFNPSFREIRFEGETLLVLDGGHAGRPNSARPGLALAGLALFDAIWISCFNLALVIRQRGALRGLLAVVVGNALVLAVFGTAQKLIGAPGLFFGAVPSPQKYFFASFVYHNHWGAFALLMLAAGLALAWHHARHGGNRDHFHSPAFAGLIVVLLLAATIPLSGSRSATVLGITLLAGTFLHGTWRLIRRRRHFRESIAPPLFGAGAAVVLGLAGIWFVAHESISARFALTTQQWEKFRRTPLAGDARVLLYHDTWRMAMARPWFGWGMGSYPHVFTLYNRRESPADRLPVFYHDAHSDWLQSLAEHGVVGTSLLALCALAPLVGTRRSRHAAPLPAYLLAGCGLVVLYAALEFPFGNMAVVLAWWFCFFTAVQYARLSALQDNPPAAAA